MSEKHQCAHSKAGIFMSSRIPCAKPGKFEENGKWWCGMHAPSRRQARADAIYTKYKADQAVERAASARASRIEAAERAVVEAAKEWARDWHQNLDTEVLEERLAARCAELEEAEHAE